MNLRSVAGLAALVFALVFAPSTWGATTIGELPSGGGTTCAGGINIQAATAGPGPSYTVPAGGGVITSWSTKTGPGPGQSVALKVLTATGGMNYTVVGTSALTPLTAETTNTFPVRIPVPAGAVLGYYFPDGGPNQVCAFPTTEGGDAEHSKVPASPEPGVGDTQATDTTYSPSRVNIQAVVEPDADKDGFGDETQDACPSNATTQGACPATATFGTSGAASGTSGGFTPFVPAADKTKPTLGALGFSSTTFKAAKSGASTSAKKKSNAKVGTKVSFNLSEPGAVKFTVQRKTTGRRVKGKCKTRTRKNRKSRRCTLWKNVKGSFTIPGKAGKNSFTFRGRIGGKSLKPASYRLNSQATDKARNKSATKRKNFKIVK